MNQAAATPNWPDRPTCHDADYQAQAFGPTVWRDKGVKMHQSHDHIQSFRSCSYCGSIHPEDLVSALAAGATMHGSDWKYGYPHKFYVDGIPNLNAGNLVCRSNRTLPRGAAPTQDDQERFSDWRLVGVPGSQHWEGRNYEKDGDLTHGKFYSQHLADLDADTFAIVAPLLLTHTGIRFTLDGGQLAWMAPSVNYQR